MRLSDCIALKSNALKIIITIIAPAGISPRGDNPEEAP